MRFVRDSNVASRNDAPVMRRIRDSNVTLDYPHVMRFIQDPNVMCLSDDPYMMRPVRGPNVTCLLRDPHVMRFARDPNVT
jgi:hypothetical protein